MECRKLNFNRLELNTSMETLSAPSSEMGSFSTSETENLFPKLISSAEINEFSINILFLQIKLFSDFQLCAVWDSFK